MNLWAKEDGVLRGHYSFLTFKLSHLIIQRWHLMAISLMKEVGNRLSHCRWGCDWQIRGSGWMHTWSVTDHMNFTFLSWRLWVRLSLPPPVFWCDCLHGRLEKYKFYVSYIDEIKNHLAASSSMKSANTVCLAAYENVLFFSIFHSHLSKEYSVQTLPWTKRWS